MLILYPKTSKVIISHKISEKHNGREVFYIKSCTFCNIHRKKPVLKSLFNKIYQKESPTQVFSCEYGKIFKSIYFVNICERLFERFPTGTNITIVTSHTGSK